MEYGGYGALMGSGGQLTLIPSAIAKSNVAGFGRGSKGRFLRFINLNIG